MATVYNVNSLKVTDREYAFEMLWIFMPIVWIIKLLRIKLPGSTDDPPIDTLMPFLISEQQWMQALEDHFEGDLDFLVSQGFDLAVFHALTLKQINSTIYRATFSRADGIVVRLQHRIWNNQHQRLLRDTRQIEWINHAGERTVIFSGKSDMLMPPEWHVTRQKKMSLSQLWNRHQALIDAETMDSRVSIPNEDVLEGYVELQHRELVGFHVDRGVFDNPQQVRDHQVQLTEQLADENLDDLDFVDESIENEGSSTLPAEPVAIGEKSVLAEIQKITTKSTSWSTVFWGLMISIVAFVVSFSFFEDKTFLLMLVPILLVHELGHWVAMNAFGYRNMRMFFIPFLGAAVTGHHLNVAGWKKASVALMGPVPGIIIGIGLAVYAFRHDMEWMTNLAALTLILNLFNLLPSLPLDGGQFLHATIYCRHRFLDVAFRVFCIVALGGLFIFTDSYILLGLAIAMATATPAAYSIAHATEQLRKQNLNSESPDGETIPEEVAARIVRFLRQNSSVMTSASDAILAQHVISVYDGINSRRPGILATITLLGVYAGSLLAGLLALLFIVIAQHGDWGNIMRMAATAPETVYECGTWQSTESVNAEALSNRVILSNAPDANEAEIYFRQLQKEHPGADIRLLGKTLFIRFDEEDKVNFEFTNLEGREWSSSLRTTDELVSVTFSITAEDPETVDRLVNEISAFSGLVYQIPVIPPWSPEWDQSPERDRWQRNREYYRDSRNDLREVTLESPELKELREKQADAWKFRDEAKADQLSTQIYELQLKLLKKKFVEVEKDLNGEELQIFAAVKADIQDAYEPYDYDDDEIPASQARLELEKVQGLFGVMKNPDEAGASNGSTEEAPGTASSANKENDNNVPTDEVAGEEEESLEEFFPRRSTVSIENEFSIMQIHLNTRLDDETLPQFLDWLCSHNLYNVTYGVLELEYVDY